MNSHVLDLQGRMLSLQDQHAAELASFEQYGDRTLRNQVRVVRRYRCRSEEHTSELQSLRHLVCRLLLEKKKHTDRPALPLAGAVSCEARGGAPCAHAPRPPPLSTLFPYTTLFRSR